jgi:hypothetical protein
LNAPQSSGVEQDAPMSDQPIDPQQAIDVLLAKYQREFIPKIRELYT